jgi:hypothetical protein
MISKKVLNHNEYHIYDTHIKNILAAITCRLILIGIGAYMTEIIGCMSVKNEYYSLFVFSIIIFFDTVYLCVKRKGIEYNWFSLTYFAYSTQIIICAWLGTKEIAYTSNNIGCLNETINEYVQLITPTQCLAVIKKLFNNFKLFVYFYDLNKKRFQH